MNYSDHPDSNSDSSNLTLDSALVISAGASNELAPAEMVGDGKIQCLSAPINIGHNNSDQSGNYLNASSAPSTAVINSRNQVQHPQD